MTEPHVFLTGSASGVGLHLTQRFIDAGYRVSATDIQFDRLQELAQERGWSDTQVRCLPLDITKPEAWQESWSKALEFAPRIDLLFNVAGYLKPGYIHETPVSEIDRHMDINVKGLIYGSQLAARHMKPLGNGRIVNIASLAGIAPIPGIALYSASKFAVRGFSLALAQELRPYGVTVTVICPDAIETPMLELQESYEEAALTFSGPKTLTVEDVGDLVFSEVLTKEKPELILPAWRGGLAKLGSALPQLSFWLGSTLSRSGKASQARRLAKKKGSSDELPG